MAAKFVSVDHDSSLWLPPDLRDWLPSEHMVHFIMDAATYYPDFNMLPVNTLIRNYVYISRRLIQTDLPRKPSYMVFHLGSIP